MASASPLPQFYNRLIPLSKSAHADFRVRRIDGAPFLATAHLVPITVDEFVSVSRHMPILFSTGADPVPLAVMGLRPGSNLLVDDEGRFLERGTYVPAYVRRYPFLLARTAPDATELTLCFDPTSPAIGAFDDGDALFGPDGETATATAILEFARDVESSGRRTQAFVKELQALDLLIDGDLRIDVAGSDAPHVVRDFRHVDERALMALSPEQWQRLARTGALSLVYAHLQSMQLMRLLFARQQAAGAAAA